MNQYNHKPNKQQYRKSAIQLSQNHLNSEMSNYQTDSLKDYGNYDHSNLPKNMKSKLLKNKFKSFSVKSGLFRNARNSNKYDKYLYKPQYILQSTTKIGTTLGNCARSQHNQYSSIAFVQAVINAYRKQLKARNTLNSGTVNIDIHLQQPQIPQYDVDLASSATTFSRLIFQDEESVAKIDKKYEQKASIDYSIFTEENSKQLNKYAHKDQQNTKQPSKNYIMHKPIKQEQPYFEKRTNMKTIKLGVQDGELKSKSHNLDSHSKNKLFLRLSPKMKNMKKNSRHNIIELHRKDYTK